jgi:cation:H+ antiporter
MLVVGLALLAIGAQTTISAAVELAVGLQVSEFVIALTIIALGTNLPELTVSIMGALRKDTDLAFGNVLGSTIFNTLAVVGASASLSPIMVSAGTLTAGMLPFMALAVMLLFVIRRRERLGRREGAVLVLIYLLYLGAMILLK